MTEQQLISLIPSLQGQQFTGMSTDSLYRYSRIYAGLYDRVLAGEREKAQKFVDDYGGRVFDGYQKMIASGEIDAVYIPLPPALHYKWAKTALEQGLHVFVEKPSTTLLADSRHLVQLAKEKKLALHENYMFLYHNQVHALDDIVQSGDIGDVRLYRITFGFPRRDGRDFRYNRELGGGALLDAGGYTLRYASYLLGEDSRLVAAMSDYLPDFGVDMYGSAMMVNANGQVAQLAFGMDNGYRCEVEIWGSAGTIVSNRILTAPAGFVPTYTMWRNKGAETRSLPADDAFLKSIRCFQRCIEDGRQREEDYAAIIRQASLV